MLLRPTTTARFPLISMPQRSSRTMQPMGVQGTKRGVAALHAELPDVERVEAVHVLVQADGGQDLLLVNVLRELQQGKGDAPLRRRMGISSTVSCAGGFRETNGE